MTYFWQVVLSNSVVASGLALVALILGRQPRRAAFCHVLWVVVLLKLMSPPLVVCGRPNWRQSASHRAQIPSVGAVTRLHPTTPPTGDVAEFPIASIPSHGPTPGPDAALVRSWTPEVFAATAWASLSSLLAITALIRIAAFHRRLGRFPSASPDVHAIAQDLAPLVGLRRVPALRVSPGILPPLVWSVGGPPVVVLPRHLLDRLSPDELRTILAHEMTHIRRGDHLVRFLELASVVAFPWHPVVWLATRRLRDLEEACCDARVMDLCAERPRAYARALVTTLEFLNGRRLPAVPLRTAVRSAHPLARRIVMLHQTPPRRLTPLSLSFALGFTAIPLALAFVPAMASSAARPTTPIKGAETVVQPVVPAAEDAVVRGRVVDKDGKPIPDARVRLAAPGAEMRFADVSIGAPNPLPRPKYHEVRTDGEGRYEFHIPNLAGKTQASFDVLKPGFRRLIGTLAAGGDFKTAEIEPSRTVDVPLSLTEATRYVRGIVVNEQGQPIPDVVVGADFVDLRSSAGLERTATRPDGTFELFNIELEPHQWHKRSGAVRIGFEHPIYLGDQIRDLDAMPGPGPDGFRVVLKAGRAVSGTVRDAAGRPVADATVIAGQPTAPGIMPYGRGTKTDAAGAFTLTGLAPNMTKLHAYAYPIKQQTTTTLPADPTRNIEVRLAPMAMPADLKTYDVLGMKLVDVTPEIQALYHLWIPQGAMILDPGVNQARFGLGELAEGYSFWIVGDHKTENRIQDVRDFVSRLLDESKKKETRLQGVRIVYSFRTPEAAGNNTQYLKLTPEDVEELQRLADRLAK